ncbi:membrane hypothetical protein [Pseudomonas sp. IT-232MI5]
MPGLSFRSRLQAGSAASSDGQRVALLVAHTRRDVGSAVAGEVVHRVGHVGIVDHRGFPAIFGHHLLGGYASQAKSTDGFELGFLVIVATVAAATIAITAVVIIFDGCSAFGFKHASGRVGASEGIGFVGLHAFVVDNQASGRLVGGSSGSGYTATGYGDCEVVFLLVEVACRHVDADVAGTIVACIVERSVIEGGRVFHIVVVVDLSCTRGSNSVAEDEAFIGSSQRGGVVLLVAVAGCNVGTHVAVRAIERVAGIGVVQSALVFHHVAVAVLRVEYSGAGACGDLQQLFKIWTLWLAVTVAVSIAMPVTMTVVVITTACLCCDCHHCCKCENQWFESHCRFHGVSPSCLLVG